MIKSLTFFPNGAVLIFDETGEQVPELQQGWMELYFDYLEKEGIDPTTIEIKAVLNDGEWKKIILSKGKFGWSYKFEPIINK